MAAAVTLAAALMLAGVLGRSAASADTPHVQVALSPAAGAAGAENGFALSLLQLVGGRGNVVYSPYSIDTALTMAAAGAEGRTASQIDHVVGASSPSVANSDAAVLQRAVASAAASGESGAPTLELANALWIRNGVALQTPFVTTLTDTFGAPPQATDFQGAPEVARQAINAWVSRHTASLIGSLLPPGSVTPDTVFVLANAIYLKANWAAPFESRLTHNAPFTTSSGERTSVPFMSADDAEYLYTSAADFQAVELPYRSSSLSLLAILPVGEPLPRFEQTMTASSLASLVGSLRTRAVDLRMPKINLKTQITLNAPLQELGMTAAFGQSANFRGITTTVPLQISLVEHAADLKVDEQGTVAAAATGIVGPTAIAEPTGPIVTVNLDRPYLLLLRDDASGAVLFVSRVADPSAG